MLLALICTVGCSTTIARPLSSAPNASSSTSTFAAGDVEHWGYVRVIALGISLRLPEPTEWTVASVDAGGWQLRHIKNGYLIELRSIEKGADREACFQTSHGAVQQSGEFSSGALEEHHVSRRSFFRQHQGSCFLLVVRIDVNEAWADEKKRSLSELGMQMTNSLLRPEPL